MNRTKIDWADYSWNPVVGCKHGCSYCYAKKINDRFKIIPKWEEPQLFEKRLAEPYKLKKSSIIFVGSMCDLFGDWIPDEWINKILKVVEENPKHVFMFLTKNPKRYMFFYFPNNVRLGITLTKNDDLLRFFEFRQCESFYNRKTFASIEPLLGDLSKIDLIGFYLVIVGAMTGKDAVIPQREWIKSIKHKNIFYKENIKKYL